MLHFHRRNERGASAVEFALVLPLFVLLVFGIMEAGWLFSQQVEIRNAAREGARLAVVDYGSADTIIGEVCSRADLSGHGATVTIAANPTSVAVSVSNPYESLTGVLDSIFGGGKVVMTSDVEMRTERPLDTLGGGGSGTCP
ncbi:MAG: TadE/TadG family type IV pilus assembly protein [Actinomycetota bacterium]